MGSIRLLILIEPSQLVLSNDPIVRHEPPIKPLQTRAPVHPHPEGVQFLERISLLSSPHLLGNVIGVVRPQVVEGSLGILLSGSLDGGHLIRVKNHKADLVTILNIVGSFNNICKYPTLSTFAILSRTTSE